MGHILRCLVRCDADPIQSVYMADGSGGELHKLLGTNWATTTGYSQELLQLIEDCMEPDPSARPAPKDILTRIRNLTTSSATPDLAHGMRALPGDGDVPLECLLTYQFADQYAVGLTAPTQDQTEQ